MTSHPIVVAALSRKRRDIAFEIGELEREAEVKRQELIHLDAVLRMFAPDTDPEAVPARLRRPRRRDYFAHGEMSRRCFDMLRDGSALAAADIAKQAMTDKGLSFEGEPHLRKEFVRRFTMQLNSMARKGDIQKIGHGRGVRWRLAESVV
jgi:hypothetical protein